MEKAWGEKRKRSEEGEVETSFKETKSSAVEVAPSSNGETDRKLGLHHSETLDITRDMFYEQMQLWKHHADIISRGTPTPLSTVSLRQRHPWSSLLATDSCLPPLGDGVSNRAAYLSRRLDQLQNRGKAQDTNDVLP